MREVPALQAGPEPVAPRRALVRAARAIEEGRRCGQASGAGRGGVGGGDGGAAPTAPVPAALGVGEPWNRRGPAVASTPGPDAGDGSPQGVRDWSYGASLASDRSRSG